VPSSDKLAHTVAFALLAFLFWRFWETFRRPLTPRAVWVMAAILTVYAGLDEYTQQFVGRGTDPVDWLCNVGGMGATLAVLEWRRRTTPRHAPQ
jgi:VanZ family protein